MERWLARSPGRILRLVDRTDAADTSGAGRAVRRRPVRGRRPGRRRLCGCGGLVVLGSLMATVPVVAQETIPSIREVLPPGVSRRVDRSIERGIEFLLANRDSHGFWSGWEYSHEIYRCAITALVGHALLARGSTPRRGPHAEIVDEITNYLIGCSTTNGLITSGSRNEQRPMYSHGLAMAFLAQVLGQTGDKERREEIRRVLHKAVTLSERAQTDDGGWGYGPSLRADEGTLTVTQLQGLRACRDAGILVPKRIIDRGVEYIRRSSRPDGYVRYRVHSSRYRDGVTCAAVVALWNAGEYESELFRRTARCVNENIGMGWDRGHHREYITYYLAQAKWVQGRDIWKKFYRHAAPYMVRLQRPDGSWEGSDGGDVFGTAVALIVLQLPYNRLPVYQR